jgi:hypothetical protein
MMAAPLGPPTGSICPDCYGVERSDRAARDAMRRFAGVEDPSLTVERVVRDEVGWCGERLAARLAATPSRLSDREKNVVTGRIGEGVFSAFVLSRNSWIYRPPPSLPGRREPKFDAIVYPHVAVPGDERTIAAQTKTYASTTRGEQGINVEQWAGYLRSGLEDAWVAFVDRKLRLMYGGWMRGRLARISTGENHGRVWFPVNKMVVMASLDDGVVSALNELTTSKWKDAA